MFSTDYTSWSLTVNMHCGPILLANNSNSRGEQLVIRISFCCLSKRDLLLVLPNINSKFNVFNEQSKSRLYTVILIFYKL